MKIKFEYPQEIVDFIKKEKIKQGDLEGEILPTLDEMLLDKNYKTVKLKKIKVVVNGISENKQKRVFISPKEISNKKPFRTISCNELVGKYSVCYLIY